MIQFWSDHSYNVMSVDLYWFLYTIFSMIPTKWKMRSWPTSPFNTNIFPQVLSTMHTSLERALTTLLNDVVKCFQKWRIVFINQGICVLNQSWPNKYVCNCTYVSLWEICKTHNMYVTMYPRSNLPKLLVTLVYVGNGMSN